MPARDKMTGQYSETYPLHEFLLALRKFNREIGTKDIQKEVGCEYRTAIAKLHELEERGELRSRKVGNAYLWKMTDPEETDKIPDDRDSSQDQGMPSNKAAKDDTGSQNGIYDPSKEWE